MKHLIIGNGNMGQRHGNILRDFGDQCTFVDLGWEPRTTFLERFDSLLICTPPNTHWTLLHQLAPTEIPIFCEKPVFDSIKTDLPRFFAPTMVACNWRWCKCNSHNAFEDIVCFYPGAVALDLIHFVDLYWQRFGKPDLLTIKNNCNEFLMNFVVGGILHRATMGYYSATTTFRCGESIHLTPCSMFDAQMRDWRYVLQGKKESWNSVEVAVARTTLLIEAIKKMRCPKIEYHAEPQ